MEIKLFVDDIRDCPKGWEVARTVTDAIRILATGSVVEVSLDHDIATYCPHCHSTYFSGETFMPVAQYLAALKERDEFASRTDDHRMVTPPVIRIHTSNYAMGHKMAELLSITDYIPGDFDPKEYNSEGETEPLGWWCRQCRKSVVAARHMWAVTCSECNATLMNYSNVKGNVP